MILAEETAVRSSNDASLRFLALERIDIQDSQTG